MLDIGRPYISSDFYFYVNGQMGLFWTRMYVCMYRIYVHTRTHMYVCMYVCMYVYICSYMYIYTYTCIFIYIHVSIYTHAHPHIYTYMTLFSSAWYDIPIFDIYVDIPPISAVQYYIFLWVRHAIFRTLVLILVCMWHVQTISYAHMNLPVYCTPLLKCWKHLCTF